MNTDFIVGLTYADRLRLAAEHRHQAISQLLDNEALSLTSLMGPMNEGAEWPAGPAWLTIRRQQRICVYSDGLSDLWVERNLPESGLGLEVFMESADALPDSAPVVSVIDTWLFPMTAEISHTLARQSKLCQKLAEGQLSSLELNIEHIKDGRGRVGVLLNMTPGFQQILDLPGGPVRLVAATLLTDPEIRFLRGKGEAGRRELADKLIAAQVGHLSLKNRPSVI